MQKALEHGRAVLSRVLIIGMCVQIVLGLSWTGANIGHPAEFGMENGVLYPVIVKVIMGMAQFLHIPYYCIVYLLQLAAAFGSGYVLLHSLGQLKTWQKVLGALAMLTVPMALQCHLALLPNSFAVSLLMLELAFSIRLITRKERMGIKDVLMPNLCWILAGVTMREYMLFGAVTAVMLGIFFAVAALRSRARECVDCKAEHAVGKDHMNQATGCGKNSLRYWIAMIVTIVSLCGIYISQENGPADNSDVTLKQAVVGRCIWSSIPYTYGSLPEEVRSVVTQPVVMDAYLYPEQLRDEFFDVFEGLEEEQADRYYGIMLEQTLQTRWKSLLLELIYDMAGYTVPGPVVNMQLDGQGHYSVTGTNYLAWVSRSEALSGFVMQFYAYWCVAAISLVILCFLSGRLLQRGNRAQQERSVIFFTCVCAGGTMILQAVYYTLTEVGLYDYKLAAWAAMMWCMLAVACACTPQFGEKGPVIK